ncbi:Uma2 family endonuclease [Kitasatospora fiedleri]|uniref:Uma2 family endonuclease n=1 Tax=Kitasatospora fiedleri TaxID=2991545 RepID=UPI00249B51E5|nr:Uma2 family endonuclease [Kitasatospora fiedleri]
MNAPARGWTGEEIGDTEFPFNWELVDGVITPVPLNDWWHDRVRDSLATAVRPRAVRPLSVIGPVTLALDPGNWVRPDMTVYDASGLDVRTADTLPLRSVLLAVEVVVPATRSTDRFRKPAQYAGSGVPSYWRVERGEDDVPVVHEFRLDREQGVYLPVAVHEGSLRTELPFPVEIDLKQLVEL